MGEKENGMEMWKENQIKLVERSRIKEKKMDIAKYGKDNKVVCGVPGCYEEAVWRTENGELLCPEHLRELKTEQIYDELMY